MLDWLLSLHIHLDKVQQILLVSWSHHPFENHWQGVRKIRNKTSQWKKYWQSVPFFIFAQHLPLHTGEKIMHIGEKIIYSAHYIPARIHHQKLWGNNNAIAATREKIKKLFWKIRLCVATTFLFCQACVRNYSSASLGCGCAPSCENKMPSSFFWVSEEFLTNMWNHFDYRRLSLEANFAREKYATT